MAALASAVSACLGVPRVRTRREVSTHRQRKGDEKFCAFVNDENEEIGIFRTEHVALFVCRGGGHVGYLTKAITFHVSGTVWTLTL